MMKKVVLTLVVMLLASAALATPVPVPATASATQDAVQAAPAPLVTTDERAELQAKIATLEAQLKLQKLQIKIATLEAQLECPVSIGVRPIDRANRIPEVGESFREVVVSALRKAGILTTESLDDETLNWVRRQDQLVNENWIDRQGVPRRGNLKGVTHFLLGTVTRYEENDVEKDIVIFGIFRVTVGGHGKRIRTGSLVVDFRLVDAESGKVTDAFRTESQVQRKESSGLVFVYFVGLGWQQCEGPLPEAAARDCARQAAERISWQGLVKLVPEPKAPEPAVTPTTTPPTPAETTQPQPAK